jgi:hypothetical protein
MKTRSKIFTTADVQGILDKRKTMFREPVKPQPSSRATHFNYNPRSWPKTPWNARLEIESNPGYFEITDAYKCPYGKVGDVIYVREGWGVGTRPCPNVGWIDGFEFRADVAFLEKDENAILPIYPVKDYDFSAKEYNRRWYSANTMPRKAARIWLQIADIKVEKDNGVWVWAISFKVLSTSGKPEKL